MNTQEARIRGYWFSEANQLPHGDDRLVEVGATHSVEGRIVICRNGLHFSQSPRDALFYAPGNILWGIEAWGDLILEKDKGVARFRTYLWRLDASELLEKFSRSCALDVIHLWDAPDIVVEFLKTGDPSLRKASYAAAYAASYTASYTASYAASHAAWAASSAASYARHAARAARKACDAGSAGSAGSAADVREKQNLRLLAMIEEARALGHIRRMN